MGERKFGQLRNVYPSEAEFFKKNPHVAGMATEDNSVILNPFRRFSPGEIDSVLKNERTRLLIRLGLVPAPRFGLTPYQQRSFAGYSNNPVDVLSTIAARLASGDPSSGDPIPDQTNYVNQFILPTLKRYGF